MSGEVPDGWTTTDIGSLFAVNTSGHWGEDGHDDGNILVLRSANFRKLGGLSYETAARRKFDEKKLAQKQLKPGDILLERSGGSPAQPVGRVNRFEEIGIFSASNFLQILRVREEVDDWFAYYLLDSFYAAGGTENVQKATTGIRNLDFAAYLATAILLPPLDEQRRIAEVLRSADEAVGAAQQAVDQQLALWGVLAEDLIWRPALDDGSLLRPLAHLINKSDYGVNAPLHAPLQIGEIDLSSLDVAHPQHRDSAWLIEISEVEIAALKLRDGDILFNRTNSRELVGKVALVRGEPDYLYASYLVRFSLDQSVGDPYFLFAAMNSRRGQSIIRTIATPGGWPVKHQPDKPAKTPPCRQADW